MDKTITKLNELIEFDPTNAELFDFFDKNYDTIRYVIDNKVDSYYYWIAKYPGLKQEDLEILQKINQYNLQAGLLENPNVTGEWLVKKIKFVGGKIQPHATIKQILEHPKLPKSMFKKLFDKEDMFAIPFLLKNPSCPPEYTIQIMDKAHETGGYNYTTSNDMLNAIVKNPNMSMVVLKKFLNDSHTQKTVIETIALYNNLDKASLDEIFYHYNIKMKSIMLLDRLLLHLSYNDFIKTNRDMQDFICDKITAKSPSSTKMRIFSTLLKYIDEKNIIKLNDKISTKYLVELLLNANTPNYIATVLIVEYSHLPLNYTDKFKFTQAQLLEISFALENNADLLKSFIEDYKSQYDKETTVTLFGRTGNEIYLSDAAKDIFLF